jgi:hypothetical protein
MVCGRRKGSKAEVIREKRRQVRRKEWLKLYVVTMVVDDATSAFVKRVGCEEIGMDFLKVEEICHGGVAEFP